MHTQFSLAARRAAEKIQTRIERGESPIVFAPKAMQQKGLSSLQQWCQAQGIGEPLLGSGGWRFTANCLQQLEGVLAYLQLRPLNEAAAATRIKRLQQGVEEHKHLGEKPFEHRVLCTLPSEGSFHGLAPHNRYPIYADWRQLHFDDFAGVVVVENADVFFEFGNQNWPLPKALEHFLLVYRGHDESSRGVKRLKDAWLSTSKPLVFFGDADYAGFSLALTGRYTHMLLPSPPAFLAHANTTQAEAKQLKLSGAVQQTPASLSPYVEVLNNQRALRQQSMLSLALGLVSLT